MMGDQYRVESVHELERWQGIQETVDDDINALDASLTTLIRQKNERIAEHEQDFKAALSEKGIDDNFVVELKKTIKKLTQEITDIENRKGLIREFEDWKCDIWETELPGNNERVADLSKAIVILHASLEKMNANFKVEVTVLNTHQAEVEGKYRDYSYEMDRLNRIQKEWGAFDRIQATELSFSLSSIKQALGDARLELDRFNMFYRDISENIDAVSSIINLNGNAAIVDSWSQLRDEAQHTISGLPDGHTYKRHAYVIERLPKLVYGQIENIETLLKSQAQRYGDQFKKLYDILIGYHRLIDRESRNLGVVISENIDLDGISDAEIGLKSRIKELGYWGS